MLALLLSKTKSQVGKEKVGEDNKEEESMLKVEKRKGTW